MKFLALVLLVLPILAFATERDKEKTECRVSFVDEKKNPWEEGLGVFGTDADDDSEIVRIEYDRKAKVVDSIEVGTERWTSKDAQITRSAETAGLKYEISKKGEKGRTQVKIYNSRLGVVLYQADSRARWDLVAKMDCLSVATVKKAQVGDSYVSGAITAKALREAHPETMKNMGRHHLVRELGDASSDVTKIKKTTYYAVYNGPELDALTGFLVVVRFLNDEVGHDQEAVFRFDRSGSLLDEAEIN